MPRPTLVIVSGPSGSGKTTLAHRLARVIGCPAICRDEIREGLAFTHPDEVPAYGDALTQRAFPVFFAVLHQLLSARVTVVAEAAFQDPLWRKGLAALPPAVDPRLIRCRADPSVAHARRVERDNVNPVRARAHVTDHPPVPADWRPLSIAIPTLDVDTTDGYHPEFDAVVAFAIGRA